MNALTVTKTGKAYRPRPVHGTVGEGIGCERCKVMGARKARPSMRMVWLLGRPWFAACVSCAGEIVETWDGLLAEGRR